MARLFCLMGVSGAGKSTVLYQLHDEFPQELIIVPRVTDRPVRPDELPTETNPEYSFKSRSWFEVLKENGAFIDVEFLSSYHYAVRKDDVEIVLADSRPGITMAGYCGLKLIEQYPEKVEGIFLSVPGINLDKCIVTPRAEQDLAARMRERGDPEDRIRARIGLAHRIIETDKVHLYTKHIVSNVFGELESTMQRIRQVIF